MFGLPLYSELIQGSALRTWDCVTQIVAFFWYKFANLRHPITMPRSRRRHHSRSRSRSRSHSHDRDREPKRRKIECYDSPHHRKSVSSEPEANQNSDDQLQKQDIALICEKTPMDNSARKEIDSAKNVQEEPADKAEDKEVKSDIIEDSMKGNKDQDKSDIEKPKDDSITKETDCDSKTEATNEVVENSGELSESGNLDDTKDDPDTSIKDDDSKNNSNNSVDEDVEMKEDGDKTSETNTEKKSAFNKDLIITPKKALTPKQIQKRLESEKKRIEKQKEKEERDKKKQEERDEKMRAKEQLRLEKEKLILKEKEAKQKEKEVREAKRKEKEEKEEQKKKEKELEKMRKQQEIEEKNKEKLKVEEQKQKAAAVFANFFVSKKQESDKKREVETTSSFMPFEVKSDMRVAPVIRRSLSDDEKDNVVNALEKQDCVKLYLKELKEGKSVGRNGKTWVYDDGSDDVTILDDLGESIVEQKAKMRAKFLKFHENQRPPYYGTFRKSSKLVKARKPLGQDTETFNYEVDSDDEWEDEEDGEDIVGSDEEDKENESENDNDYEVDNDVFVPHGHLSDDEGDKDDDEVFNPEAQKAKMKLLNSQFLEERKSKTSKIKPRVIGCIWQDNNNKKEDDALLHYLQPFSIISNNIPIIIRKRTENLLHMNRKSYQGLEKEYIPDFLRFLHGNTCKKKMNIVDEYLESLNKKKLSVTVHKYGIAKQLKQCAQWMKCPEEGPMFKVPCWYVSEDVQREFSVKLELPKRD